MTKSKKIKERLEEEFKIIGAENVKKAVWELFQQALKEERNRVVEEIEKLPKHTWEVDGTHVSGRKFIDLYQINSLKDK